MAIGTARTAELRASGRHLSAGLHRPDRTEQRPSAHGAPAAGSMAPQGGAVPNEHRFERSESAPKRRRIKPGAASTPDSEHRFLGHGGHQVAVARADRA